ncbi:hypothetical protein SASPL_105419 [Salvia splendens]|uniref:Uncharacterized protein n=1 Tax=Salvia splendens TaxID=180675 RepID=A0A8X9A8N6_SALSN|nr:hypothetical protein SASPL_105419 [Salvia splendens]
MGLQCSVISFYIDCKRFEHSTADISDVVVEAAPFTFNTRLMSLNPCERALEFRFHGIDEIDGGFTSTTGSEFRRKCDKLNYKAAYLLKAFNVTAGLLHPQYWNKSANLAALDLAQIGRLDGGAGNYLLRTLLGCLCDGVGGHRSCLAALFLLRVGSLWR